MKESPVLIFDFDGTLADSEKYIFAIFQKLAIKYLGRKLSPSEISKIRNDTQINLFKHFNISVFQLAKIIKNIRSELNNSIHLIKPYPGIKEVVQKLKIKKIPIGIVSSNTIENIKKFLENNKMQYFDFFNCGASFLGKHKKLSETIRRYKLTKENVIYIGDELRDIDAARKIKIKVAAVTWGFNLKNTLIRHKPDYLIEKPEDLPRIAY